MTVYGENMHRQWLQKAAKVLEALKDVLEALKPHVSPKKQKLKTPVTK